MAQHFYFGKRSLAHLATVHPELQQVAKRALQQSRVDFTIISGLRTMAEQEKLVAAGKSQTLKSRHLDGMAIDFVPLDPITGKGRFDRALAIEVAAAFMDAGASLGCPIKWGGMWKNFEDIPHIEIASFSSKFD